MGDITDWIGVALTTLVIVMGALIWVLAMIRAQSQDFDRKLERMEDSQKEDLKQETKLREESMARVERQVDAFSQIATSVVRMGSAVEHLTEKFGDHQRSQDRALDELKHSIRNVEQRLAAHARLNARTRAPKGSS